MQRTATVLENTGGTFYDMTEDELLTFDGGREVVIEIVKSLFFDKAWELTKMVAKEVVNVLKKPHDPNDPMFDTPYYKTFGR